MRDCIMTPIFGDVFTEMAVLLFAQATDRAVLRYVALAFALLAAMTAVAFDQRAWSDGG